MRKIPSKGAPKPIIGSSSGVISPSPQFINRANTGRGSNPVDSNVGMIHGVHNVYNTSQVKMTSKYLPQYDDVDIPDGIENISDPDLDEDYIETN